MDMRRLARYPFLPEAREYVRESGISLGSILESPPEENYVLQDAWNRVVGAMAGRIRFVPVGSDPLWSLFIKAYSEEILRPDEVREAYERSVHIYLSSQDMDAPEDEESALYRMLSYALARIIVSCMGDSVFIRRYALKEAELFRSLLEKDFEESGDMGFLRRIGEELGMKTDIKDGSASMDVISYVKSTAQMKDRRKHLLFQDVMGGMVHFQEGKKGEKEHMSVIFRSFQQALQDRLIEELPLELPEGMCEDIFTMVDLLRTAMSEGQSRFSLSDLGSVEVEKFPPCMKKLLSMAKEGINLPHSGRFALTAFLHMVGMSVEEIVSVFSSSPDFNEAITTYQVRHIAGEISGTEYTPQKCSVLISEHLCPGGDSLCQKKWMNHPLTYYRVKKEGGKGKKGRKKGGKGGKKQS